jgi:hypothetical protein
MQVLALERTARPAVSGRLDGQLRVVWPVESHENLTIQTLDILFDDVAKAHLSDSSEDYLILLAVVHQDSTVVYYKIHAGLKKPEVN